MGEATIQTRRHPVRLESSASEWVVDHVRWGWKDVGEPRLVPEFQKATIRPEAVVEVYWWSESFPPEWIAAHGQLAFVFDQDRGVVGADGRTNLGLVYTVEPLFEPGESFDVWRGFRRRDGYPLVHQITTLTDRIQRAALIYGQNIRSFRLRLEPHQKVELVRTMLETATRPREGELYHTTRRSCVTETVRVLNQVLEEEQKIPLWAVPGWVVHPDLALPRRAPKLLVERGLAVRDEGFGASVRVLRFPQSGGREAQLSVLDLPGAKLSPSIRALEEALFQYSQRARELREWDQEIRRLRRAGESTAEVMGERARAEDALLEAGADVSERTLADLNSTVPFLLALDRPETAQAELLVQTLVGRVREAISEGRWAPGPNVAEALEAIFPQVVEESPEAWEPIPLEKRPFVPRQRQVRILSETGRALEVENLRWGFVDRGERHLEPEFQTATLDPEKVAEVYWWSESFPPKWLAAHGQLAFLMKDETGLVGADGRAARGMIYSVEAHYREGQRYSPIRGLHPQSEYGLIHILTTLTDRLQQAHCIYRHSMDTYRLLLSKAQKAELLRAVVHAAGTFRPKARYHTTRRSCVSETIRTLNLVLEESQRIPLWTIPKVLHNLQVSHPKWTPPMLIERGLAEVAEAWDENSPRITIAPPEGPPRVFEMASLPGSRVSPRVLDLEEALHRYAALSQSIRDWEAEEGPEPEARRHREHERSRLEAQRLLELETIVELTLDDLDQAVPYLLELERPPTVQAKLLLRALVEAVRGARDAGDWSPEPELAKKLEPFLG